MSSDKLPPGVSVSDIHGNRPEDEAVRSLMEDVEEEHPDWSAERVRERAEDRYRDGAGRRPSKDADDVKEDRMDERVKER